jgi:hypothetical protein
MTDHKNNEISISDKNKILITPIEFDSIKVTLIGEKDEKSILELYFYNILEVNKYGDRYQEEENSGVEERVAKMLMENNLTESIKTISVNVNAPSAKQINHVEAPNAFVGIIDTKDSLYKISWIEENRYKTIFSGMMPENISFKKELYNRVAIVTKFTKIDILCKEVKLK